MSSGGSSPPLSPKTLKITLAMEEMQKQMRDQLQNLQRDIEELRVQRNARRHHSSSDDSERRRRRNGGHRERRRDNSDSSSPEVERRRRARRENGGRRRDDRLEGLKLQVPPFMGLNNPEAYLEWELKMEQLFDYHDYSEGKKVKVAALEFKEYAMVWWDQYQKDRRRCGGEIVDTWEEMKMVMRKRFVPNTYHRDVHNKLQRLTQGNMSVDDYHKEMELALLRSNIHETREATMARFLHGLNQDIQDVVELQPYVELEDLVQKAIKMEQQLRRKKSKHSSYTTPTFSSAGWKDKPKKEGGPAKEGATSTKEGASTSRQQNQQPMEPKTKSRDVKCFKCLGHGHIASQCPTKRAMVVRNGEVESQSEASSGERSEEEMSMPDGDLLMVRRLLGSQVTGHEGNQRESIFRSRCLIQGNVCTLIIDGGSCANVASSRMVSKLNLPTKVHPTPYKLQWLSEAGELMVDQQVEVPISIGKYEDTILCDVAPMEASHILLGRPWQYDKKAIHDGFSNKITFMYNNRKVILSPLSPQEVRKDQKQMKKK